VAKKPIAIAGLAVSGRAVAGPDPLDALERDARQTLERHGYPVDLPTVRAILTGKQPAPWTPETATSARHAMAVLHHVDEARTAHTPTQAVLAALQASLVTPDATLGRRYRASQRARAAYGRKQRRHKQADAEAKLLALVATLRRTHPDAGPTRIAALSLRPSERYHRPAVRRRYMKIRRLEQRLRTK
jgi:hypothetical protein